MEIDRIKGCQLIDVGREMRLEMGLVVRVGFNGLSRVIGVIGG